MEVLRRGIPTTAAPPIPSHARSGAQVSGTLIHSAYSPEPGGSLSITSEPTASKRSMTEHLPARISDGLPWKVTEVTLLIPILFLLIRMMQPVSMAAPSQVEYSSTRHRPLILPSTTGNTFTWITATDGSGT